MQRRAFLQTGLGTVLAAPLRAAVRRNDLDAAVAVLTKAAAEGQIYAGALYVRHRGEVLARSFGASKSPDDMFLLASVSKPICVAALMTLYDKGEFRLDDKVKKFIPEFTGDSRDKITIRQLLTHVSGLPNRLPEFGSLWDRQAKLSEHIARAIRTPLLFEPGSRYGYANMGILVACEVAQRISRADFLEFIDGALFQPLEMKRSALGLGRFRLEEVLRCQIEKANKKWDWNSLYWRKLGAPWGGVHASAKDVATFFGEFLYRRGAVLRPETARLMVRNHNRKGLPSRGLGFDVGAGAGSRGCSEATFGHTGVTGTLAWADSASDTICIVLTTLPGGEANPHPRKLASDHVAKAVN
jgi:CubicO group peptidase (beta-lactamase class C family)